MMMVQRSRRPKKRPVNLKKKLKKANVEYRIMNIECRSNVFYLFYK